MNQTDALQHPSKVTITCEFPDGAVWTLSSVAPAMKPSLHVTEIQDQRLVDLPRDPFQVVRVTGLRRDALFTVQGIDEFTITRPDGPSQVPLSYEMTIDRTIEELIEASSLGTPEAQRLRASVSPEAVAKVMARVRQMEAEEWRQGCCDNCGGTGITESGRKCWDCYGTGCCHPMDDRNPCPRVPPPTSETDKEGKR